MKYTFIEPNDSQVLAPLPPSEQIMIVRACLSEEEDFKRAKMDFRSILHTFGISDETYNTHIKYLVDEFTEQLELLHEHLVELEQNEIDEEEFLDSIEEHFVDDDELFDNGD